jgi:HAD superfamily hydrolase (TIGR01549 family)
LTEAVIFDLDGTLISLPINYDRLFQEISKITKTNEIRPITKIIANLDEKARKKIFEKWETIELDAFENMTMINEGMNLYKKYHDKPKALVTMQGRTLVKHALEQLTLSFDYILTREDSLSRTEQIRTATQKLKTNTQKILFIGNTDEDANAARETGCKFLKVGE